jgi:hypothetical protein
LSNSEKSEDGKRPKEASQKLQSQSQQERAY